MVEDNLLTFRFITNTWVSNTDSRGSIFAARIGVKMKNNVPCSITCIVISVTTHVGVNNSWTSKLLQ